VESTGPMNRKSDSRRNIRQHAPPAGTAANAAAPSTAFSPRRRVDRGRFALISARTPLRKCDARSGDVSRRLRFTAAASLERFHLSMNRLAFRRSSVKMTRERLLLYSDRLRARRSRLRRDRGCLALRRSRLATSFARLPRCLRCLGVSRLIWRRCFAKLPPYREPLAVRHRGVSANCESVPRRLQYRRVLGATLSRSPRGLRGRR
jgi:hypothetical protein